MADYSGYYACGECGADGVMGSPAVHAAECSVPGKLAAAARKRALAEHEKETRRAEMTAAWEDLGDEALLEAMRGTYREWQARVRIAEMLGEDYSLGVEVVRRRGMLNELLRGGG